MRHLNKRVVLKLIDRSSFSMGKFQAEAKKIYKMNWKSVLQKPNVIDQLIEISFIPFCTVAIAIRITQLYKIVLRMDKTAGILSLDLPLTCFGKDMLYILKDYGRLLKVFEYSDGTLKHNESKLKNIDRSLNLQVNIFIDCILHKFRVSTVKIE